MKIDLFLEFAGTDAAAAVENGLARARTADGLGFDAVWVAEHHFLGGYSLASCPEMLLAAMARETRRIGLGFGILPLPLHDPVRVAEKLATLDLLSDGRLLWGVGRGVAVSELAGFGVAPADTRALMLDRLDQLRRLLAEGGFEQGGSRFTLQPPPRPELAASGWLAAVSPESFDLAASLGLNVLSGPFKPWPMVAADLARYRRARPDGATSFALAVHCDDDGARARRRAGPGIVQAYRRIFEFARPLLRRQMAGYEHYRSLGRLVPLLDRVLSLGLLETLGLAAVGTPSMWCAGWAGWPRPDWTGSA